MLNKNVFDVTDKIQSNFTSEDIGFNIAFGLVDANNNYKSIEGVEKIGSFNVKYYASDSTT